MATVKKIVKNARAPQKDVTPSYITDAIDSAKELRSVVEESIEAIVDIAGAGDPNTRKRILDGMCNSVTYQMPWRKKDLDDAQERRDNLSVAVETGDDGQQFALERAQDKERDVSWTYYHFKTYHDAALESYKAETGTDYRPNAVKAKPNADDKRAALSKYRK